MSTGGKYPGRHLNSLIDQSRMASLETPYFKQIRRMAGWTSLRSTAP